MITASYLPTVDRKKYRTLSRAPLRGLMEPIWCLVCSVPNKNITFKGTLDPTMVELQGVDCPDSRQQTMLDQILHKRVNKIQEKAQDVGLVPAEIPQVIPKACKGLENLQATYSRDPQCSSEIETSMLIEKPSGIRFSNPQESYHK